VRGSRIALGPTALSIFLYHPLKSDGALCIANDEAITLLNHMQSVVPFLRLLNGPNESFETGFEPGNEVTGNGGTVSMSGG
jgi:hypothetical protein